MTRYLFLLLLPVLLCTCDPAPEDDGPLTPSFDREAMLAHWADNVFAPHAEDFAAAAAKQQMAATSFQADPTEENLGNLRTNFAQTYVAWQQMAPFLTGAGEAERVREQMNTYPTDTARLLADPQADLRLPSNTDVQGFPALDYLLFGTADPAVYRDHILRLTGDINERTALLQTSWSGQSRDNYVSNSGNSATASVDRTVNDFIFWYERHLRAGKVGLPAGVFSSTPRPALAEAPYHGDLGKRLFLESVTTAERFFNTEPGLKSYLDALGVEREGQLLSDRINTNFAEARAIAVTLDDDFATQVTTDNMAMLRLYDALQRNVILLKVDLLQALGINVDFVDADGD